MPAVKDKITAKINGKKVVIFSKSTCPYCKMAKDVLKTYNLSKDDYEVLEINNDPDGAAIQAELKKITRISTVPQVFVNGKCIGGGDDTTKAHKNGSLQKMIDAPRP
ncbi:GRXC8-like protein [Mya arenaria]|uniref:GRXC8-like protein n=1 Tax=Mya arenaria TaxID=6604 RepID=A0ABY7DVQ9_MYAAR|nr:uncharacterized protein LOC128228293 [Mya arenaria]WAR00169.1 GRXC8-like protein [Mya arenaria]